MHKEAIIPGKVGKFCFFLLTTKKLLLSAAAAKERLIFCPLKEACRLWAAREREEVNFAGVLRQKPFFATAMNYIHE